MTGFIGHPQPIPDLAPSPEVQDRAPVGGPNLC